MDEENAMGRRATEFTERLVGCLAVFAILSKSNVCAADPLAQVGR